MHGNLQKNGSRGQDRSAGDPPGTGFYEGHKAEVVRQDPVALGRGIILCKDANIARQGIGSEPKSESWNEWKIAKASCVRG
jgi:hypothetical protein